MNRVKKDEELAEMRRNEEREIKKAGDGDN